MKARSLCSSLVYVLSIAFLHASKDSPMSPKYLSGGDTTVFIVGPKAFSKPLANIKSKSRRQHSVGNSFFNQNWIEAPASAASRDGLGPLFNARSCSSCHAHDGKGFIPTRGQFKSGMVTRLSVVSDNTQAPDPIYGTQLSDQAILNAIPEAKIKRDFKDTRKTLTDGRSYTLRLPDFKISNLAYGKLDKKVVMSHRLAPAVFGLGLIEAIPESSLLAHADINDSDGDGISGRPHFVKNLETGQTEIGRFGWKATQPTIKQQSADAFLNDIGITSSFYPHENTSSHLVKNHGFDSHHSGGSPEISDKILNHVSAYLATIAPPARRKVEDESVLRGEKLFDSLKCATCHVPEFQTGEHHTFSELSNQPVRAYSDFLLHDMGAELADNRPDQDANGQEWRTPPLWGIGLQAVVSRHSFFLHDGRAKNVIEAILWHGGEAANSRDAFLALEQNERIDSFNFLMSL